MCGAVLLWEFKMSKLILMEKNTLGRLVQHLDNGFICISASRDGYSEEANRKRTREMQQQLKQFKLGYWKTRGGYIEKNEKTQQDIAVYEDSFLVPYSKNLGMSFEQFESTLAALGDEYEQQAILVKQPAPAKNAYFLYLEASGSPEKIEQVGSKITTENALQYFTKLKNGKKFAIAESSNRSCQIFMESPNSSFEAQMFALNKQKWFTGF